MANAGADFNPVLITVIEGNQALWSVLLSVPLQGLGMSEPELSPFQELYLLQGVYFLGVVKILLLYNVVAVTSPQTGALKQCQNFSLLPFHHLGGRSFINSFNKLLDARYHAAADIAHTQSLLSSGLLVCRRDKVYRSPK